MFQSRIHNTFNGTDKAYIYIWLSKNHKVIYIGMTNSFSGTIGRANGHFIRKGTLRKRFIQNKGYQVDEVDDFILLSFPLPKKRVYTSAESSYREAVEYLVHKELLVKRTSVVPTYDVISWYRNSPRRTSNSEVKKLASDISKKFITNYSKL